MMILLYMTEFNNILSTIDTIKVENFKKFNIIINNSKDIKPDNNLSYKVKELKNTISKQQYFNSQKIGYKEQLVQSSSDLSNSINIQCTTERLTWSKLSKKEKLDKLQKYIESNNIPEDISVIILKKRINKKDVEYDIFTEEIKNLIDNGKLNNIVLNKTLIFNDSPLLKSTAPGFMIESSLKYYIKNSSFSKYLISSDEALSCSDYIFKFKNIIIHINLKAVKNSKCNSGIAALNNILKLYNKKKPVLYMVFSICWKVNLEKYSLELYLDNSFPSYYLDSFILDENLKIDNRSWSSEKKKISGRIQCPRKKKLKLIENILSWNIFKEKFKLRFSGLVEKKSRKQLITERNELEPDFKLQAQNGKYYSLNNSKIKIKEINQVANDFDIDIYQYNYT